MDSILAKHMILIGFLSERLSKQEIRKLEEEKKKKIFFIKDNKIIGTCKKELATYFSKGMDKTKRNNNKASYVR